MAAARCCGRGQIELLAGLCHTDAPNEVAASAYNEDDPPGGLAVSPLAPRPRRPAWSGRRDAPVRVPGAWAARRDENGSRSCLAALGAPEQFRRQPGAGCCGAVPDSTQASVASLLEQLLDHPRQEAVQEALACRHELRAEVVDRAQRGDEQRARGRDPVDVDHRRAVTGDDHGLGALGRPEHAMVMPGCVLDGNAA